MRMRDKVLQVLASGPKTSGEIAVIGGTREARYQALRRLVFCGEVISTGHGHSKVFALADGVVPMPPDFTGIAEAVRSALRRGPVSDEDFASIVRGIDGSQPAKDLVIRYMVRHGMIDHRPDGSWLVANAANATLRASDPVLIDTQRRQIHDRLQQIAQKVLEGGNVGTFTIAERTTLAGYRIDLAITITEAAVRAAAMP